MFTLVRFVTDLIAATAFVGFCIALAFAFGG